MLAVEAAIPEFDLQNSCKKSDLRAGACNPSAGEVEIQLGSLAELVSPRLV